ncbi:MAG: poly-gamma-glutamate biosynthesis protein PgsC [Nitrospiraceae bacterium]|nr:MAG: poly-gamma-glutamate biosynthesis protein PgsC [Nitrospiraceae bacterium]
MELLPVSIGVGLVVSLLLSEIFGLTAGGLVVPGYIALHLTKPLSALLTVGAGFVSFVLVHLLSSVMVLYGRRRIILLILAGYLTGMVIQYFVTASVEFGNAEFSVIGFIIPGLIAIWFDRRGIPETLGALTISSVIVRLVLIVFLGGRLAP